MKPKLILIQALLLAMVLLLGGCIGGSARPREQQLVGLTASGENLLERMAPLFLIDRAEKTYNRIGTPKLGPGSRLWIDSNQATIYAEKRPFSTSRGQYYNLIYRVNFSQIPAGIFPFYLGAGKNVGLFIVITLNADQEPLLITSLHSCGCYLAIIPTGAVTPSMLPPGWNLNQQFIYGERLPGQLKALRPAENLRPLIHLRAGTHRVRDISWINGDPQGRTITPAQLQPLAALQQLPSATDETGSFFYPSGPEQGYVRDSHKPWEQLFIGWWALDHRVGRDKRLGRGPDDGPVFYTSLKPWARNNSDMRDFAAFLSYWGWQL